MPKGEKGENTDQFVLYFSESCIFWSLIRFCNAPNICMNGNWNIFGTDLIICSLYSKDISPFANCQVAMQIFFCSNLPWYIFSDLYRCMWESWHLAAIQLYIHPTILGHSINADCEVLGLKLYFSHLQKLQLVVLPVSCVKCPSSSPAKY